MQVEVNEGMALNMIWANLNFTGTTPIFQRDCIDIVSWQTILEVNHMKRVFSHIITSQVGLRVCFATPLGNTLLTEAWLNRNWRRGIHSEEVN